MHKVILFDVDGVLIRLPRYFSKVLEEQGYPGAAAIMDEYHAQDRESCLGKSDSLSRVQPYLDRLGWQGSSFEYFREQFIYEGQYLDMDLLGIVKNLRTQGFSCWLATDQDYLRKAFLLDDLGLRRDFDGYFVSSELGACKVHPDFWTAVLEHLAKAYPGLTPPEVLFIDDSKSNTAQAAAAGLDCFHIDSPHSLVQVKTMLEKQALQRQSDQVLSIAL